MDRCDLVASYVVNHNNHKTKRVPTDPDPEPEPEPEPGSFFLSRYDHHLTCGSLPLLLSSFGGKKRFKKKGGPGHPDRRRGVSSPFVFCFS